MPEPSDTAFDALAAASPDDRPVGLLLPRILIFLTSLWMIGSWLLAIGLVPPVHPSSSSYRFGLELMLINLSIGLIIGWPLLRLSQAASRAPIRQTILDLIVLVAMVQVVLWPLRLVTSWPTERAAAIDATLTGWCVLAGAIVAATTGREGRGPRRMAMLACIALCLFGPLVAAMTSSEGPWLRLGPLTGVHALAERGGAPVSVAEWRSVLQLTAAAIAAWVGLLAYRFTLANAGPSKQLR